MTKHTLTGEDHYGSCPRCAGSSGCITVGRTHWLVCDTHLTRWLIGSNLFSDLPNEEESRANQEKLEGYEEVTPLWMDETVEIDE